MADSFGQRVLSFLENRGWEIELDGPSHDDTVRAMLEPPDGPLPWVTLIAIRETAQQVIVYTIRPDDVPESRRRELAEFLTWANYGLAIGNFELDFSDGEVRYKSSVDLDGTTLGDEELGQIVDLLLIANLNTFGAYADALEDVLTGTDPRVAALAAESD